MVPHYLFQVVYYHYNNSRSYVSLREMLTPLSNTDCTAIMKRQLLNNAGLSQGKGAAA